MRPVLWLNEIRRFSGVSTEVSVLAATLKAERREMALKPWLSTEENTSRPSETSYEARVFSESSEDAGTEPQSFPEPEDIAVSSLLLKSDRKQL